MTERRTVSRGTVLSDHVEAAPRSELGEAARLRPANVFSVDLEDWPIAVLGPQHEITPRVVENTKRCLRILESHDVAATFFVLTKVAEQYPDLIREVHAAGHEIASHGHGHELLMHMTPDTFERDVATSIDILEGITGERPVGYRAPAFSILKSTRWAGPILSKLGFVYSSSVFPIRHPRYGIADARRDLHQWDDGRLIECPPATIRLCGRNLPIAGGGYFRMLPGAMARHAIGRINRMGMPGILYFHPYELDVGGVQAHCAAGLRISVARHFTQELFRSRMEGRLHRLFESFEFATMRQVVDTYRRKITVDAIGTV